MNGTPFRPTARRAAPARRQTGGFAMGLIVGLLVGLGVALAVALYITKAPIPFINKVPQRTAEQDTAEAERNRHWDPNAPLAGKPIAPTASGVVTTAPAASAVPGAPAVAATTAAPAAVPASGAPAAAKPAAKDPAAILAGGAAAGAEPYIYFVQTGAYTRGEDAEQQKAKLAMIGQTARVSEREQAGRTVYRVRLGPFPSRDEADALQAKLQEQAIEAQIVRVEKP